MDLGGGPWRLEGAGGEGAATMRQCRWKAPKAALYAQAEATKSLAAAREKALYAQAEATNIMAAALMYEAAMLEDRNLLTLMLMPGADDVAKEYLRLRRSLELKKLKRRLTDEEEAMPSANDDAKEYLRLRRSLELKKLKRRLADEEEAETRVAKVAVAERGEVSSRRLHGATNRLGVGSPNSTGEFIV